MQLPENRIRAGVQEASVQNYLGCGAQQGDTGDERPALLLNCLFSDANPVGAHSPTWHPLAREGY